MTFSNSIHTRTAKAVWSLIDRGSFGRWLVKVSEHPWMVHIAHMNCRNTCMSVPVYGSSHFKFSLFQYLASLLRKNYSLNSLYTNILFSLPLLKAQVSFSPVVHRPSVRLLIRPSVCDLFTFSTSPEPLVKFQPNLAQAQIARNRWVKVG